MLPIATEKELTAFENIFLAKTTRDLTDGHIWFSIIMRPPRSNFTRLQRVGCCLCLLLSTMLSNAMFYRVAEGRASGKVFYALLSLDFVSTRCFYENSIFKYF